VKKFLNLLTKEIKEIITRQLIFSMLFTLVLFYFMGELGKSEVRRAAAMQKIFALDLDGSQISKNLINSLELTNFKIDLLKGKNKESAIDTAKKSETNLLLIIPQGFGESVAKFEIKELETYTFLRTFSISGIRHSAILKGVISAINNYLSNNFLQEKVPGTSPENIKNPIKSKDFVLVKNKMAEGSASSIAGFVSSQSLLVPVVLMMIVIYCSNMVISAIAMEKQNKTLETLLTVPISRASIITAKMLSAGIVGLISAAIYMLGYRYFMSGFFRDIPTSSRATQVIKELGLSFSANGYLLFGLSLFFAILCALALAMILGVLAEDFRSAQGLVMPVIFLVMIPYFISIFSDISSLSLPFRILVLAIPFSHPFLTTQNIFLQNYQAVWLGIIYMFIVFIILVIMAARIFSSDKILTMKLKFGKKRVQI